MELGARPPAAGTRTHLQNLRGAALSLRARPLRSLPVSALWVAAHPPFRRQGWAGGQESRAGGWAPPAHLRGRHRDKGGGREGLRGGAQSRRGWRARLLAGAGGGQRQDGLSPLEKKDQEADGP